MKLQMILPLSLIISLGCATRVNTSVTRIGSTAYPSKDANCEILVFTQMPIDRKFEEIAILNAVTDQDSFTKKDLDSILPTLKTKACELGANALVIKSVDQGGQLKMTPGDPGQTPTKVFCVAIRFLVP